MVPGTDRKVPEPHRVSTLAQGMRAPQSFGPLRRKDGHPTGRSGYGSPRGTRGGAGGRPLGQLAVFGYAAEASRSVPVACGAPIWTSIRLGARERTAFGRVTSRIPFS